MIEQEKRIRKMENVKSSAKLTLSTRTYCEESAVHTQRTISPEQK